MDRPPEPYDPTATTQPIRVTPVAPPSRPRVEGPVPTATTVPPRPGPYVHRFGSVPFYLFARFAAFAIDIFAIGFVLATFGYHATDAGYFMVAGHDSAGYATLASIALGCALLVAFLCEATFGTTLGKLVFALHTRRSNGAHAGAVRVFARYLLRPIDLLAIGPLLALVTPRHQRIGDFLGGTVVARSRIGPFAAILGILALAAIGYAQIAYGGGITSAIGVSAETADFAPGIIARATRSFGVPAIVPQPIVGTPPSSQTDNAATPAPIPSGSVQ